MTGETAHAVERGDHTLTEMVSRQGYPILTHRASDGRPKLSLTNSM